MKKLFFGISAILLIAATAQAQHKIKAGTSYSYVSMERTTCFGTCPNYKIEISSNGHIKYTGRAFAKPQGTYEKKVSKKIIASIFDEMRKYNIDTCSEMYPMKIADLPGIIYYFKSGSTTKHIQNAQFGPVFLKEIADDMDSIGKPGKGWKKTASYKDPR